MINSHRVIVASRLPSVVPDKSLGTWHNIEERDNDWILIQVMIIYIGYVKFRDYDICDG